MEAHVIQGRAAAPRDLDGAFGGIDTVDPSRVPYDPQHLEGLVTRARTDVEHPIPWVQGQCLQNPGTPRRGTGRRIEFLDKARSLVIKLEFGHLLLPEIWSLAKQTPGSLMG